MPNDPVVHIMTLQYPVPTHSFHCRAAPRVMVRSEISGSGERAAQEAHRKALLNPIMLPTAAIIIMHDVPTSSRIKTEQPQTPPSSIMQEKNFGPAPLRSPFGRVTCLLMLVLAPM